MHLNLFSVLLSDYVRTVDTRKKDSVLLIALQILSRYT